MVFVGHEFCIHGDLMGHSWDTNGDLTGYSWDIVEDITVLMEALAEENGNGQESRGSFEQIRASIHHYIPISIPLISHEVPILGHYILCSTSRKGNADGYHWMILRKSWMCLAHDFA